MRLIDVTKFFEEHQKFPSHVLVELSKAPTIDPASLVKRGRWEIVTGVLTPGGDPLLRCPFCKSRESEHLCGVESRIEWRFCPKCGALMED